MANIHVTVDDAEINAALKQLADKSANMQPAMEGVAQVTKSNILFGFRGSVSPYGRRWLPLKLRKGEPLVDTGTLRSSITLRSTKSTAEIGTNKIQAPIHQFGGVIRAKHAPFLVFKTPTGYAKKKSVRIPARPFMPIRSGRLDLPKDWATDVLSVITTHLGLQEG
ncbi:MAG: phage virion morphogenesis protein [Anaerolineae bacterium]|nr:phage virion morphogenesis protein [Anaerolineae bacterium]MCP5428542.1 phage virion morphogenesis protein [Chromatiaceae bacterium]